MSCRDNPLPDTPYKGLMPYSEEDAPFFFGREGEREIITANLLASRLTLLYGASGVGKSSVLRAGVAYHLRQVAQQNLAERGTPEFAVVVFSSWRDDPLAGLADRVRDSVAQALSDQTLEPVPPSPALAQTLQAWTERVGGDLLIILDQFEEYFLYHPQEDGEGTFAVEFPRAVNRPDLRVGFLISIREDSLAKLDRFKGRMPNLFDNYLRIEHLDREAARAAIEKPVEQYNRLRATDGAQISIEPALVEAVLEQVRTGQVVLGEAGRGVVGAGPTPTQIETPYLQLVMTRLWEEEIRAGSRTLRLETLNRLGGAVQIVERHLDVALSGLPPKEQEAAAGVFHHLVTPSGTKIAHTVPDLAQYAELAERQVKPVLDKLSGAEIRILRPVPGGRYEIFHDVLAPAILDWRVRYVQAQERAEAKKQLARARRRVMRMGLGLIGLFLLLIVMGALAIFAYRQWYALGSIMTIIENADRSVPYFKAVMRGHTGPVTSAAFSPDGKLVVTASWDGTARVWEAATGRSVAELRSHKLHGGYVHSAQFSPDGNWVVTAADDGTARLSEASTGRNVAVLSGHGYPPAVVRAAFSPDGKFVVTASQDQTARVWDAESGQQMMILQGVGCPTSAAYSPDGQRIVTASRGGTARVWEATTGKVVAELRGDMAAFSPDGQWVVTAADDTARVWDAESGQQMMILQGHDDRVRSAAYSPDGQRIVTASDDGTARVWEAATGKVVAVLGGPTAGVGFGDAPSPCGKWVGSAAFSPDGKWVVTTGDFTARVWEAATGQSVAELRGHLSGVTSAAFSPDGKWVVTASYDFTARVWDVSTALNTGAATGQEVARLAHVGPVDAVAFSPDGQWLATGSEDRTARVWLVWPEDLIAEACARLPRNLTPEEWERYLGDEPYRKTCPDLPEPGE